MKKALKWIFFVILIVIFAIDVAGFWKYKLKKSNNTQTQVATSAEGESDATPEETNQKKNIEYTELTSKKFSNGEKLFIKNISEESDGVYEIKGLIYEECRITSEEYKNLKSGKSTIEILGVEYSKDKIESNNIKLKSSDEKAKKLYIKYDSKTKKYIVKDSTKNNSLYKPSENYVKVSVSESLEFDVVQNGKTNKQTVKSAVSTHSNISNPKEDEESINLSTLTFNKKGVCTKITEASI